MATADQQIGISAGARRELEGRRRPGESYNDVLERLLEADSVGDFDDGFGRWSDGMAERIREERRTSKEKRWTRERIGDRP